MHWVQLRVEDGLLQGIEFVGVEVEVPDGGEAIHAERGQHQQLILTQVQGDEGAQTQEVPRGDGHQLILTHVQVLEVLGVEEDPEGEVLGEQVLLELEEDEFGEEAKEPRGEVGQISVAQQESLEVDPSEAPLSEFVVELVVGKVKVGEVGALESEVG